MLVRAGIADRKRWFKFAGWLWAGGVHEMRWIKFFIADAIERKVTTEFAYYAPGSEARTTTEIRAREASADEDRRDNERHVRELFGK
jgi:hypothetical protein